MVATISTRTLTATHGSLKRSISDYTAGQLSKQDISRLLATALENNPECGGAILECLDRELRGRRLSATDHKELTAGLQAEPSENIPTETSEVVPDRSGLYLVDDEGTLVLAEDFEVEPPSPPDNDAPHPGKSPDPDPADVQAEQKIDKPAGLKVGAILRERFRLDEEVASGSMGLVYRATDLLKLEAGAMSPVVAVKVINPKFANDGAALKSFQNEVANTQHLSHPNIIHLFEIDKHDGHFFMTMEWLEGESLDTLLDRSMGSALPPIQAYAIIEQLCDALAYAHARNVVHADVKPGNVFLTKPGELKLIDFGIAQFDDMSNIGDAQDKEQKTIGLTPAYASCEALEKQKPTPQDDLFSLACLVYRLLSGRRAFGSITALQAEEQGVELVPIGGMSESRWAALAKALSFRRIDRQPDVKSFAEEFGQRMAARQYEVEADDAAFAETMTLQALPEGVDFPGVETAVQGENKTETPNETRNETKSAIRNETTNQTRNEIRNETKSAIRNETKNETRNITRNETANELEIDPELFPDATAITPVLDDFQDIQPESASDDLLIDEAMLLDSFSDSLDADEPVAEPDDPIFVETMPLGTPAENVAATTSDTVNLEETAPLGAASFSEGVDLLGTDLIGAEPDANPVKEASADTQELDELPDPINFFDADSDDSVFVPLDDTQPVAPASPVDATDQIEILPDDGNLMEGGAAHASTAAEVKPQVPQSAVSAQSVKQPPAAKASAAPAPSRPAATPAAAKPAASPAPAKPAGPKATAQPAVPKGSAQAAEESAEDSKSQGPSRILAALTGAPQATGVADRSLLGRFAGMARAKTLQLGGVVAVLVAVLAVGAWWLFGAGEPATGPGVDQSAKLAATNAKQVAPAATRQKQAVAPTELLVSRGSQGKSAQPNVPVRSADAGIATGDAVVAVPLSLASQSASDGLPGAVGNNPGAAAPAPAAPKSRAGRPVTVGYMIGLHNLARKALAAGNLVEPADASAMVWIDEMRAHEPNSKETLGVQAQLADGLLQRAQRAVAAEDAGVAERWAALAEKYGADSARLLQIQRSITGLRTQLERQTAAAQAEAETAEQDAADTEADELSIEIPVPLSAIEFTRYAEPVFPTQLLNTNISGWVDLRFTIGIDGETRNIEVTGSDLPADFVAPSIAAVDGWSFQPYMHNGEVVPVNSAVRLNYAN